MRVEARDDGTRLDVFLARELRLSRGYVRRLLSHDAVRVNGAPAAKGMLLRGDDRIEVEPFRHPDEGPIARADFELRILCERDGLIAVDKPAGHPTQPLDYDETGSVLNAVLARFPDVRGVGEGGLMSGVVHRLDRDTSGVLLFARSNEAWHRARAAFDARGVEKTYLALVHGRLSGEHELALQLAHRGPRMRVVSTGGREALTRVRALEPRDDATLVEARPVTGLMHQIRVSLSELGHPIVGDALYGSTEEQPRHWLHAERIRIDDFEASSEPPPELRPGGQLARRTTR
jgi:23S rRNA pseudouridine1911/1915/1917 synthase